MLATTKQRDWVYWLLRTDDGMEWLNRFVFGDTNIRRLEEVLNVGTYDETTKHMLNFLRERFMEERDGN